MHTVLLILQVLFAIALIFIVAMQTTRHEGLTGTVGGQVSSQFRGKLGRDEQLAMVTRYIAVGFFLLSLLVAITSPR
ncbi:MAG: preprotein translocase subunit SecG [Armatimonadota bacterium]|nr:preprotein translocase subunit SecG [bacterium]MDW8103389.1 preprotein translocase subunit SecG [Armatimonadota bacterium]MDW8289759.1 preprotein translocase subunit SecG [Armatimonadota bacterium]